MKKTIFVVDDERIIAETFVLILCQSGYEARAFLDAESALEEMELMAPDLLLSDIHLSSTSGIDLALTVADRFPKTRVILLSGQPLLSQEAHARGFTGEVFEKPVEPETLLASIAELCASKQ